ncbi:MAG TPA: 50S ribosomal protein L22 [Pyrinomonadaceae bacterium]|jgi:large subunit ribosomal protein L22
MEAIAKTRHLKGSPRKARLVIDLIRGRNVSQALAILKFTDKRAADPIAKTLRSAIANATYLAEQQNIAIDPDDLWVKTCFVDMGAHKNRRRMRPAPQGRAYKEQRHYCHITILVTSEEQPKKDIKESKKGKEGDKSSGEKTINTEAKTNAKTSAKKDAVKETKTAQAEEAKVEEVKTTATEASVETSEETSPKVTASEAFAEQEVKNESDASDVKDASSQRDAEQHETKPADEAQLNRNEELERQ